MRRAATGPPAASPGTGSQPSAAPASAALAGSIDASRTLSILGGTSIVGGEGSLQRTVVGCLFVAQVANGFNLLGFDPFYQQVTLGIILLLAVGTDAWSRRLD